MNRTSPNAKIFLHLKPQAVTSVFFDFFNLVVLQFKSVNLVAHLYDYMCHDTYTSALIRY